MMFVLAALLAAHPPVGPSPSEVAAAVAAAPELTGQAAFEPDDIRSLRCRPFEEEPTEYRCRFRASQGAGRWKRHSAIVALDGGAWILLSLD